MIFTHSLREYLQVITKKILYFKKLIAYKINFQISKEADNLLKQKLQVLKVEHYKNKNK